MLAFFLKKPCKNEMRKEQRQTFDVVMITFDFIFATFDSTDATFDSTDVAFDSTDVAFDSTDVTFDSTDVKMDESIDAAIAALSAINVALAGSPRGNGRRVGRHQRDCRLRCRRG